MKQRQELEKMGNRILDASRTELFLSMRFLGPALDGLSFVMDVSTRSVGTDGVSLRYHPEHLFRVWMAHPYRVNRAYVHMLLHCLFRHMYHAKEYEDPGLWNLCCDIAAESVLDSMDSDAVRVCPSDLRESWYEKLSKEVSVLTAEKLYAWFCEQKRDYYTEEQLRREFSVDDHSFWERLDDEEEKPQENPDGPAANPEDDWNDKAKRLKEDLESAGTEAADEYGSLSRLLRVVYRKRTDYRKWLKRFSVLREETKIDPDSFDYHFYYYGLSLYGNMPLIELELRETVERALPVRALPARRNSIFAAVLINDGLTEIIFMHDQFRRRSRKRRQSRAGRQNRRNDTVRKILSALFNPGPFLLCHCATPQ